MGLKEWLVNWLVKGVIFKEIRTKKLIDKGNTAYIDIVDFDHQSSDPGSPTESLMWYNSTAHVLRYRNNTETVDVGAGDPTEDVKNQNDACDTGQASGNTQALTPSQEFDIITVTLTGTATDNIIYGYGICKCQFYQAAYDNNNELRLYIDGTVVATSPSLIEDAIDVYSLHATKTGSSGNVIIKLTIRNDDLSDTLTFVYDSRGVGGSSIISA